MAEWRLFGGPAPEWTTAEWYAPRERARHLEEPGHRGRLLLAASHVLGLAAEDWVRTVVDLGAGDGGLLSLIGPAVEAWGYDLCPAAVAGANADRQVDVTYLDVVAAPGLVRWGDVAVATELFEHLADPHAFARTVAAHCRAVVASSPVNETPAWHYEFHTWAWDPPGYRALFEQAGLAVTRHEAGGSTQVLTAVKR